MVDKNAVLLLYEAAEIVGFDASKGWPVELSPKEVISLFVGYRAVFPLREPSPLKMIDADGRETIHPAIDLSAYESDRKRAQRRECGIVAKMLADAGLRELIEQREQIIHKPPPLRLHLNHGKLSTNGAVSEPSEKVIQFVVSRESVRFCLGRIALPPPLHLAAWLNGVSANSTVEISPSEDLEARVRREAQNVALAIFQEKNEWPYMSAVATRLECLAVERVKLGEKDSVFFGQKGAHKVSWYKAKLKGWQPEK